MNARQRFLAACAGQPVDRPPVWLMRQAGRYMPEYRAIRARHDFLTMVKTPELAAEITLQPVWALGVDAAILFSDILNLLEPYGLDLRFDDGKGPSFANPIRSADDLNRLRPFRTGEALSYVAETVRRVRAELGDRTALIGFSGAPLTLAVYSIEGHLTKEHHIFKRLLYSEPEVVKAYLARLTDRVVEYLILQIEAGADAVQLFDTWGGTVDRDTYARWVHPGHVRIVEALKPRGCPVVLFVKGGAPFLDLLVQTGADVIGLDWTLSVGEVAQAHGRKVSLQGNLDPSVLLAPPDRIRELARPLLESGRRARGHIVNLGHGILPNTPVEHAKALVETVQGFRY